MRKLLHIFAFIATICCSSGAFATDKTTAETPKDTVVIPEILSLEDAINISLGKSLTAKLSEKEIKRKEYSKRGSYASLFPQISGTGVYQRTIKKQIMYLDFDMSKFAGIPGAPAQSPPKSDGIEVGRSNTYNAGVTASMPIINFPLWESIKISAADVEMAVEKARASKLEMITQVKQAYYSVLLAKEVFEVYKSVFENAHENYKKTESMYKAGKASDMDLMRMKATLANSVPNVSDSENQVFIALWQLKALIGVDLDSNIDVDGKLCDYISSVKGYDSDSLNFNPDSNPDLKQISLQLEQLHHKLRMEKYAYLPSLGATFSYTVNAMENDYKFENYKWTPFSYVGLSLSVPIFSGGKRYYDVKQTKTMMEETKLRMEDAETKLRIAIRKTVGDINSGLKTYSASIASREVAQKAYEISLKSYDAGKGTLTDLNDASTVLVQSRLASEKAAYNVLVAKSNLEKILGTDY